VESFSSQSVFCNKYIPVGKRFFSTKNEKKPSYKKLLFAKSGQELPKEKRGHRGNEANFFHFRKSLKAVEMMATSKISPNV